MAIKSRALLKSTFQNGYIPTQNDFADVFDSYVHKQEDSIQINANGNVGIGLGVNTPARKLHVGGDVQVDGTVYANDLKIVDKGLVPTGGIIMWSGASAPAGWGLCNGGTYPRSSGIGTITTPNLKGRFIVGYDPGVTDYNNPGNLSLGAANPGKTGGFSSVTLTAQQSGLPVHDHGVNDPKHSHGYNNYPDDLNTFAGSGSTQVTKNNSPQARTTSAELTNITIANNLPQNAAQAHENRPPYYVLAFIMKL